jgi:hypothetical protein
MRGDIGHDPDREPAMPASAACGPDNRACGDKCIPSWQCCTNDDCSYGQFCYYSCMPTFDRRPLINVGSNKCFAPTPPQGGDRNWAGLPIQQRTCDLNLSEHYYTLQSVGSVDLNEDPPFWCWGCIHKSAEGFFIRNNATGQCLDARDGAKSDGSVVQQWTCRDKNARSMVWYIHRGEYSSGSDWRSIKLKNANSELCLDVRSGSSDEFAQLQQYHCTADSKAQNFRQGDPCIGRAFCYRQA